MMNHSSALSKESVKKCESDYLQITGLNERSITELIGFACAKEILKHHGPFYTDHIVIYAGPEKNGGEGVSTALFLAPYTKKISICMPTLPSDDLFNINLNRIKTFYPNIEFVDGPAVGDIYIDALFGIGLTEKPSGMFEQLIKSMNEQPNPIISIDIPSGIDANTSLNFGEAVKPDLTLAIGCLKPVHQSSKSGILCGEIVCLDIGMPQRLIEKYAETEKIAC